jgi:ferredoxin, 2Fe-2S
MMPDRVATTNHFGAADIRVKYGSEVVEAEAGQRLLDAILGAGFDHRHICGGRGFCTSCRVEVVTGSEGLSAVTALERERLGPDAGRLRLACQTSVRGPATVRVPSPAPSRFSPDGD